MELTIERISKQKLYKRRVLISCIEKRSKLSSYPGLRLKALTHQFDELMGGEYLVNSPSDADLSAIYEKICGLLTCMFQEVTLKTHEENQVWDKLKASTKVEFHRSFWLGRRNFDLFTSSIKSERRVGGLGAIGLFIEVDGKVHDRAYKMMKDEHSACKAACLSIPILAINNDEINEATVINAINKIKHLPRTTSFERSFLHRQIHWETILSTQKDAFIADLLGININKCIRVLSRILPGVEKVHKDDL